MDNLSPFLIPDYSLRKTHSGNAKLNATGFQAFERSGGTLGLRCITGFDLV